MNPYRLWNTVFLTGFAIITALFAWTLFTPPYVGDLTRMGFLSERQFAWRDPQPAVEAAHMRTTRLADADIVVVGDSFSATWVWQSELVKRGLKVKTLVWGEVGLICADFGPWLRRQGYRGQVVVVQSVERELADRLEQSVGCRQTTAQLGKDEAASRPVPDPMPPAQALNWGEQVLTGARTWHNTRKVSSLSGEAVLGDSAAPFVVRAKHLEQGCRWFSHALCSKGVFLNKDFIHPPLEARMAAQMQEISKAQLASAGNEPPVRLLWLAVPNKTTVYLERSTPFWGEVEKLGLGPDLYKVMLAGRDQVRDLYLPNETHLSNAGYLLLGRTVVAALGESAAPGSSPGAVPPAKALAAR
jgi:hypothetical protein